MWNLRQILDFLENMELEEIAKLVNEQDKNHPVKTIRRVIKRIKEEVDKEAKKYVGEKG